MAAPKEIAALVERFDRNLLDYRSSSYNEAQTRQEFINPFFKALGWDMDNEQGFSESYKEVLYESSLRIGSSTKAPDYAFRIGEKIKFIVEAKKPSIDLEKSANPAYQLRHYAWNAHLPISILTDFDEFAIYDCRYPPKKTDTADTARLLYLKYTEYLTRWDEIAGRFSKTAILQGSFDKYVVESKDKKGTKEVDDAFLEAITSWRESLARNIAIRNPDLSVEELNACVQATIDRIVFLRICEDREIEEYGQLQEISDRENVYAGLCDLFKHADDRYNSGLFHFKEDERKNPDLLSLILKIDDKVLSEIISSLYPPSPYNFALVPPEILGQVYEQFLGKVIRLTEGHRAKVEDKPAVKKAGGVFYTPAYIVDYIVENTVGKLLDGKTPAQVSELHILDPACGSGSFLLGAYKKLLTWHLDWYIENLVPLLDAKKAPTSAEVRRLLPIQEEPKENNSRRAVSKRRERTKKERMAAVSMPIYKAGDVWRLTLYERKRILLQNIYGVDIDPQAVEVTKLSLLLKVLEGESREEVQTLLRFSDERALPDLDNNIKCGNSLIGWDIHQERQDLSQKELNRINPFDWEREFSEVFQRGGFDAVIGNPPYIRMESFKDIKSYLREKYMVHGSRSDLYAYFIERGHRLLHENGLFSMIISNKFIKANYGHPLRQFLRSYTIIKEIADFAGLKVFPGATVRTMVLTTSQTSPKIDQAIKTRYLSPVNKETFQQLASGSISISQILDRKGVDLPDGSLTPEKWLLINPVQQKVLDKIHKKAQPLSKFVNDQISWGIKTGLNKAFIINSNIRSELISKDPKSEDVIKPILFGEDVKRYAIEPQDRYLIYTYHGFDISAYPSIEEYLKPFKKALEKRATKQEWYELQQPSVALVPIFNRCKILYPEIAKTCQFTLDDKGYFSNNKTFILPTDDLFILGLLNSKVALFYFKIYCAALEGEADRYLEFRAQYVRHFPIVTIDFTSPQDVVRHDRIVSLVALMLSLHKQLQDARTPHEQTTLRRQIGDRDKQIDRLVYELYDLTEEEISIVEGESN